MTYNFKDQLNKVLSGSIEVDELLKNQELFNQYALRVINGHVEPDDPELEAFIRLCNDVYTYSSEGSVMIPDSLYDQVMQIYKSNGNPTIVYADSLSKKWDFIPHEIPGVVGTIAKVYTYKELKDYFKQFNGIINYTIAPKYDGISCAIRFLNGEMISAATRYDGQMGQNITNLVKNASNFKDILKLTKQMHGQEVFFKCELCVSTENFEELVKVKKYSNRRSATSGIVNTPTNIGLAKFITIIPLVVYIPYTEDMYYIAPKAKEVGLYSPADFMDELEQYLEEIRGGNFPFRVDGVVIYPDRAKLGKPNRNDLMDTAIAYKVNTMEGKTRIKYGYMSVGRLGKGMPMVKVYPVEVNETIVEDVSLGSYDKFLSMDLHENEEVIVYSAGDVIPQIKLPRVRANLYNDDELKIPKICPYCNHKMERVNTEYYCMNDDCPRIITGRISNFLVKLGVEGFSDKSVEMIYNELKIRSLHQFLLLDSATVRRVPGFDKTSADELVKEIRRIRETPCSPSKFFGALGIDKISEKKCKRIFEEIDLEKLLKTNKYDKYYFKLQRADGIGPKTAKTFMDFIKDNHEKIEDLMSIMSIGRDQKYIGNVCFTGFRPTKEFEEKLKFFGYEVGNSVTGSTVALVAASRDSHSTKMRTATAKGIQIFYSHQLDSLIKFLTEIS